MRTVVSACIAETTHISMIEFFCLLVAKKDNTAITDYEVKVCQVDLTMIEH